VEGELAEAPEAGQLVAHYQPIVSLGDGTPVGCEALVRWEHPQRGLVQPVDFVPIAEDRGLIGGIGRWMLREACATAHAWRRAGEQAYVSVNVSPVQLIHDDVVGEVRAALAASGLPAPLLYMEVTESSLIDDASALVHPLLRLRRLGVRIAMDDFGGGSSSLSFLSTLPIDVIKIDKLFVQGLPDRADDRAIVSAVISMAEELDLAVIAEGVENERQHWELRDLGCEFGQGFLYAEPQPASDLRLDGYSATVQPGVGDPSVIREFMRQIGIPARVES
jgi:EAL domain-containing protein (putative c-di-GMP-specific phosphodiesterase class I)